jgi:saccharopine dehydrogenase (NAD+, L-lysine-forming)
VQQNHIFSNVYLASRSLEKCLDIQQRVHGSLEIDILDAGKPEEVLQAIEKCHAEIVINAALPYQNLCIMEACLKAGVHYIDTAVSETPEENCCRPDDVCWYGRQWRYKERFKEKGLTAILGAGSDPGMVNVFCAYAAKHVFDEILTIDILDVNAGDHGFPFATNFNTEINLREVQNPAFFWADGNWQKADPLSVSMEYVFPEIGPNTVYLMDHDEIHSLNQCFSEARHIKFWMGFDQGYIKHIERLREIGLLSVEPVGMIAEDGTQVQVVPVKMLNKLLPDPAYLGEDYRGKVCIGCLISGKKRGETKRIFIYNICDHQEAFSETGTQAIYYAAGIPTVVTASLLAEGPWRKPGVFNLEQFDPDPFLKKLSDFGLDWHVREEK